MPRTEIGQVYPPQDNSAEGVQDNLDAHIVSPTPHPAYDDDMNLDTYLENGLA